jgi:hypothetical protein
MKSNIDQSEGENTRNVLKPINQMGVKMLSKNV